MDKPNYTHLKPGVEVGWRWGNGLATGTILSIHPERTEIISKNSYIVRNGTIDNPAVIIEHKNGNQVLKLAGELQALQ
jgi:hypothetical protein